MSKTNYLQAVISDLQRTGRHIRPRELVSGGGTGVNVSRHADIAA